MTPGGRAASQVAVITAGRERKRYFRELRNGTALSRVGRWLSVRTERPPIPAKHLKERPMNVHQCLVGAAVTALVALGPSAMAQQGTASGQPGTTTGPATGSPVEPSTAVQKQSPSATGGEAAAGAVGAGAPGVTASPGTQGGPPPTSSTTTGSMQSPATEAAQGGVGAGSPGVSAKPGTQGGESPATGTK